MRYIALWFVSAVIIFNGLLDAGYSGPEFTLIVQPIWSAVLSSGVLILAILIGLPVRLSAVSRVWHGTAFGIVTVGIAIALGCIFIGAAWAAKQHATARSAILGLCGLLAIEFAVIHWPKRRKA